MRLSGSGEGRSVNEPADPNFFRTVTCPRCQGDSVYASSNPYRPFCSQRCKASDFGAWADESFRLAPPAQEGDDELPLAGSPLQ